MLLTASFACEGIASIAEKNALSQKEDYVIFSPILQWLLQYMYLNARMNSKESMLLFIFKIILSIIVSLKGRKKYYKGHDNVCTNGTADFPHTCISTATWKFGVSPCNVMEFILSMI